MYSLDGAAVVLLSAALLSPVSSATVVQHPSQYTSSIPPPSIDQLACYNTVLTISCPPTAVLVFESARYGRNDTVLAARCAVPYTRHCDVDAHFLMNRACAGRRKCSLVVGASVFGDPCGYEEFLRVEYRCVPVTAIYASCPSSTVPDRAAAAAADSSAAAGSSAASAAASAAVGPNGAPSVPAASATSAIQQAQQQQPSFSVLYGRGYLSSPSYPDRYYSDAECRWTLVVQRHQTIRVTIYDFELDIKKAGRCKDYLEITGPPPPPPDTGRGGVSQQRQFSSPGIPVYFRDCGALGRHTVDVESNRAVVRLVVDQSSLTQRGFFLYFEAMGPGCDDTPAVTTHAPLSPSNGGEVHVVYYFDDATTSDDVTGSDVRAGTLRANVSCVDERAVFAPTTAGRRGGSAAYRNAQKPMTSSISVYCSGTEWSEHIPTECVDADTIQQTVGNSPQELVPTDPTTSIAAAAAGGLFVLTSSASIIGIVLGGLSALLSVVLTLVIAIYCYSRRRRSSRKNSRQRLQLQQQQQIVNNKWRSGASTISASEALIAGGRHGRSREAASCRSNKSKTCAGDVIDTEAAISVAACRIQLQQQQQRPPDVCIGASQTLNPAGAGPQTVVRRTAVGCKICAAGNCSGSEYAWLPPPPPPPSGKHPYPGGNRPSETDVEYITTKTEVSGCSTATDVAYCPGCIYTVSAIHQQQQQLQQQCVGVFSDCNQLRRYPSSSSSNNRRRSASRYTVVAAPFVDISDPFSGHSTSGLTGDRPPSRIRTLTRPSPTGVKKAHAAPTPGPIVVGAVADGQSVIYCPDCAASDFCGEIGGSGHRDPYRRSVACSAPDLLFTISSNCSSNEQQASALMNATASGGACTDDTVLLPVCDCGSYTEDSCDCRLDDDEHLATDGIGTHLLSRGFNDGTPDRRRQDTNGGGSGSGASDRKSSSGSFGNWSPFGRTVNTSV